jgi:hypothetical protein
VNLRELYLSNNGIEVIEGLENNVRANWSIWEIKGGGEEGAAIGIHCPPGLA